MKPEMSKPSVQSTSRVYLRGVNLVELTEKYLNNEFINLMSPLPVDSSLIDEKPQTIVTVKETGHNMSYQLDIGAGQTFACIGYKVCDKDGRYAVLDPNRKYRCMYCLRKIQKNPLGIPIRREVTAKNLYFHMVDIFCGFNCLITEIKGRQQNAIYSQSMAFTGEIYHKCTGRDISEIKPADDRRLLKIFNGPLTWEQFHNSSVTYSEKPGNMFFVPVIEYIEQNP